jgi:hypothetical protein
MQLLNLGLKDQYTQGVQKLGFNMEDLLGQERDAALGNGGLGRLAACYLDSSASQVRSFVFLLCRNLPCISAGMSVIRSDMSCPWPGGSRYAADGIF